jgi:hypothetical protein
MYKLIDNLISQLECLQSHQNRLFRNSTVLARVLLRGVALIVISSQLGQAIIESVLRLDGS